MTRINCVHPSELIDKHLLAEHYELPRVFTAVAKVIEKGGDISNFEFPKSYRMGEGHVKFFYPRLGYLNARHKEIQKEMFSRGFKIKDTRTMWLRFHNIPALWWGFWVPDQEAMAINRQRLKERS